MILASSSRHRRRCGSSAPRSPYFAKSSADFVAELDRRRHDALDVKLQVKRHALGVSLTGTALAAISGLIWWRIRCARPHRGVLAKAHHVRGLGGPRFRGLEVAFDSLGRYL
jgi:hypothetical protein